MSSSLDDEKHENEEQPSSSSPSTCEFVLVGNISHAISSLLSQYDYAFSEVHKSIHFVDLVMLLILAFLPHQILKFINDYVLNNPTIRRQRRPVAFEDSWYLVRICNIVCQLGQLGLVVYGGELFLVFLSALGVPHLESGPQLLASFVYSAWMANTLSHLSCKLITGIFQNKDCTQQALLKRIMDFIIYGITIVLFLHANHFDIDNVLKYMLTLGGVSSVVVGLALKDPLAEIVQGTLLLLTDKIQVGDTIRLRNSMMNDSHARGKILSIEWMDVVMEGTDGSLLRIPHSQLAKVQIVNLSRMKQSQVSQTITLSAIGSLDTTNKVEEMLQSIRDEIANACPKLMKQYVYISDTNGSSIVVCIETHHNVPRLSAEYQETRQVVVLAIQRGLAPYNTSKKG